MQGPGFGRPSLGVGFDSDFGNNIDGVLALALLHGLDGKNELRLISLSVSKSNLKSAALCDAIERFYAGPRSPFSRALPIGYSTEGKWAEETPLLAVADNYEHSVRQLNDTADVAASIRNSFTAQQDQNAVFVLAGPANNLALSLELPGAKDIAARKVRCLVATAALKTDLAAARRLLALWPGQIVLSPDDLGLALPFPGECIEKEFDWAPKHPVADAYRAYRTMPYDAPAPAMAAALFAVRPKENYFKLSDPGTISIGPDGQLKFAPSADGKHHQLIYDPAQKERIILAYRELVSAKPVVRAPRRFQQQEKPEEKKPEEKKPEAVKSEDKKGTSL